MKHTLLIAVLLTLTFGLNNANAQRGSGPKHGKGGGMNPVERLTEELGLDEAQAVQVQAIHTETRAMHENERTKSDEDFCAIKAGAEARVMAVLNEDQQSRFTELKQQRSERGANTGGHGKGQKNGSGSKGSGGHGNGGNQGRGGPPDCSG